MLLRRLSTTKTKRLETKLNFMKIDSISNKVFLGRVSSVIAITLMALAPSVIKLSEMEIFDSYLLKMSGENTKKEINGVIKILVKKSLENQEIQEKVISWSESESVEIIDSLISGLREIKWWEIKELKEHMYEKSSDLFVNRLLRGNRESVAAEIRIKILSDSKRSEEMRARLIEDLVGRQVDKMTLEIIKQISISESVLLSTISKEFLQEYE